MSMALTRCLTSLTLRQGAASLHKLHHNFCSLDLIDHTAGTISTQYANRSNQVTNHIRYKGNKIGEQFECPPVSINQVAMLIPRNSAPG